MLGLMRLKAYFMFTMMDTGLRQLAEILVQPAQLEQQALTVILVRQALQVLE
jgi:hypothetical protein